jgi:hypothetical protein
MIHTPSLAAITSASLALLLSACAHGPSPAVVASQSAASAPAAAAAAPAVSPAVAAVLGKLRGATPSIVPISVAELERVHEGKGLTDCFWVATLHPQTFNILIPDLAVTYWISQFRLPAGARLDLKGSFPHARYMSFASYNPSGQPVDGLADDAITPDAGSVNPYQPGAQRLGAQRSFTVHVQSKPMQAGTPVDETTRPANTLFVPTDEPTYQVWLRVYAADQGLGPTGGAPLPAPVMTLADGSRVEGEALCRQFVVKEGALRDFRATRDGLQGAFAVPGAKAPFHPAQPGPVTWNAFYNPPRVMGNLLVNTPFENLRERMDKVRRAGFYSTLDNVYMSAYVDNRYGDALVLRAKAPRTPRTQQGTATLQRDVDMRYWSICKSRSVHDGATDACLLDEQVPQDAQGRYTVVISTPQTRPANARNECGVAWMPWGTGDGMGNPHGGFLVMRHLKPTPGFAHSLAATKTPGDESAVLGPYYPETTYEAKAAFEARGCPVK